MFYIAAIFQDCDISSTIGYADRVAIVRFGKNAMEAISPVQGDFDNLVILAREHRIEFHSANSELLVTGGPRNKINTAELSIMVKDFWVEKSPHIRWLGIWLEYKLSLREWSGKANCLV